MKNSAQRLILTYVDGWKKNRIEKILAPLTKDCVIVESHGPTYHGASQIKKWVLFWIKEKGRVLHWDITSFYFLEKERIAFFEWDFACRVRGKDHKLFGISIVKFRNEKISFIHEYRMTKDQYNWSADELKPE